MAKESQKKVRRLKAAPQTMRERAESASNKRPKSSRAKRVAGKAGAPFRKIGSMLGKLKIWKPFRFIGRLIARFIIPPYLRNSFKELRLVAWPSRKQTAQLTFAVLIFATATGLLVAIFDLGLDKLFKQVVLR